MTKSDWKHFPRTNNNTKAQTAHSVLHWKASHTNHQHRQTSELGEGFRGLPNAAKKCLGRALKTSKPSAMFLALNASKVLKKLYLSPLKSQGKNPQTLKRKSNKGVKLNICGILLNKS